MTEETTCKDKPVEKNKKLTPKAQAEMLIENLLKGKEVHQLFSDRMKSQLLISGQPMEYWEKRFKIHVQIDALSPSLCKELNIKILVLNEEATFHYAVATAKSQLIKKGGDASYNAKFWTIVQEFKSKGNKIPGQETLKAMASINNEDIDSAQTIADIESKFWKSILEHLYSCRKLVDSAGMNLAVELKAKNADDALDRMINNGGKNDRQ